MSDVPTQSAGPAVALAYDELPDGSDLRRAYDGKGGVTITAPAGELSAAVRRSAARAGVLPATIVCAAALALGGVVIRSGQVDPTLRTAAMLSLGVLAGALFLLVWWVLYSSRTYVLADLRRQSTVIHADRARLLVETSGPLGDTSIAVAAADILSVDATARQLGGLAPAVAVAHLRVRARDRADLALLPGLHPAELRWVAATLAAAAGLAVVTADPSAAYASRSAANQGDAPRIHPGQNAPPPAQTDRFATPS